jgi:diguanylate cyclase (GGDEF)-like protein
MKQPNHIKFILYLVIINIFAAFNIIAAEKTNNFQQKPLTIAINESTYPYQFIDERGQAAGLMVDLWNLWAEKQQVTIEFVPLTWSKTLAQVKNGKIDVHAGLAITDERRQFFAFTPMFFKLNNYLYLQQNLSNISRIEQLAPYAVGAVKNSGHIAVLKQKYSNLKIKVYPNRAAKYQAALNGEILVFADIDKFSKKIKNSQGVSRLFPSNKRLLLNQLQYGAAVAKNRPTLLRFIAQGFAQISFEEQSAIERKWLGINKQNDTLLLSFSSQLPPYMALSPTGRPQGLFIDLWRLWSKYTGQKIDFVAEDFVAATALVKQQSVDVMVAYPEGKKSVTGLKKAWPIYKVQSKVFVSARLPNIQSLANLTGHTIGLFITSPYKLQLDKQYPNIKKRYFSDISSLLNAAENREIDAMISSVDLMNLKLMQTNLQSSFYLLDSPVFISDLFSLVAASNERLAEMISDGFSQIPVDDLITLEKKWLPNKASYYFEQKKQLLVLSKEEQVWQQQEKQVDVGVVKNWQPMEFVSVDGELQGINVDILKLIGERADLHFNFVIFDSWKKLYQALLDKKIAMSASISPTDERKQKLIFSKAYWKLPWAVVHRQQLGNHASFTGFYGKKIAVVKGYQLVDEISEQYPQISLVFVDTTQEGFIAVQQGVVDGLLEPLVVASELLKKESLIALTISIIDDLAWDSSHIAIRKDWPELRSIIDKGIVSIQKTEKQKIYEKWFNVKVNTGFDKNIVFRVALQVGILIFIVIVIIVIWNRRLYQEVKRRKALEEKMKHMATHDELTGLANRALLKDRLNSLIALHQRQHLQMAILFIDLDGFKTINDTFGHDVGDELLIQLSERFKGSIRTSDTLVRFGGDEFVVILTGLNQGKEASFIADKILQLMKTPFNLSVTTACISCSIGIALYPNDGITDTELLKVADTLMYKVKGRGKNNYIFTDEK